MATALTSEYTRFTDKCNKVLAGGIVKTFEPNSLTPKISYQDPNKEIPNLTEVHLDETGRAKIYIDGDYRIQVYSRDGVLIEDNLLVEQSLVQRDFTELSQEIQVELQQALDQFQIESTAAVDNLNNAIASIGGMVVDGQLKLDWTHVFNKPNTLNGYGITNAYTKLEANAAFIEDAEKGVASGVAPLNANAKVDDAYLSAATESTKGTAMIASSISVKAATDDARFVTPLKLLLGLKNHLNVSGDAPMYACRAWVNFNGVGVVAINSSGNVSSITDNGIGDYTINFLTPMPHANYSLSAIPSEYSDGSPLAVSLRMSGTSPLLKTTSSVRVSTRSGYNSQVLDVNSISAQVIC